MSRIGKQPVAVPPGVKVQISPGKITAEGPKGKVSTAIPEGITVDHDESAQRITVLRADDSRQYRTLHGTIRSLISNMIVGVSEGFGRRLEIHGLGYNARVDGQVLELNLGFSKPQRVPIPEGLNIELPNPTLIAVTGADKQVLGQFAATVRKTRPPNPYKGKGIRYENEKIRRKAGKAFAGQEGG